LTISPAVSGDAGIDDFTAQRLHGRQGAAFVAPHQTRVTGDIGRRDGGKAALFGHRSGSAALGSSRPAAMRRNV
jgi:hypothetical protein